MSDALGRDHQTNQNHHGAADVRSFAGKLAKAFEMNGILVSDASTSMMRLVTHLDVTRADLERLLSVIRAA